MGLKLFDNFILETSVCDGKLGVNVHVWLRRNIDDIAKHELHSVEDLGVGASHHRAQLALLHHARDQEVRVHATGRAQRLVRYIMGPARIQAQHGVGI